MKVPFVDLQKQYSFLKEEVFSEMKLVLETANFIGGPALEQFESEFAAYCGAKFSLGVGSGTDALELALLALGIGPGDEVITQANSFIATASAIVRVGARPIFVDIDPVSYTIDPKLIEQSITPKTKAIIPVHLYGQPADMNQIMEIAATNDLYVVEDAAQAHGATYYGRRVGSIGDVGCFSFYPGKNLGAYGDGGAITSSNSDIIERVAKLRDHGRETKYEHSIVGTNSRLDSIQAAVLKVKLGHLEEWNSLRQQAAGWYDALLADSGVKLPKVRPGSTHVYHLYVIECDDRDWLQAGLNRAGVACGIHYPKPLHLQPALASFRDESSRFGRTEKSADRILSLPIFPEITYEQVEYVARQLRLINENMQQLATA